MKVSRKLSNIKAAVWNIWFGHYFVFDPGNSVEPELETPKEES